MRYEDASVNLKSYDKFIIDPVIVHFAPNAEGVAINPTDLKVLTDYFHSTTVQNLSANFQLINQPGPGVLLSVRSDCSPDHERRTAQG